MNYIKEMNAFHDRMMTNPVSVGAKVLWSTLMHVNNKARWVKKFSIAESLICGLTGLSSSAFKRARVELRDKGLITYQSRGTKAPMYQMVSLVMEGVGVGRDEEVDQEVSEAVVQQKKPKKLDEEETEELTEEVGEVINQEESQVADQVMDPLKKRKEMKIKRLQVLVIVIILLYFSRKISRNQVHKFLPKCVSGNLCLVKNLFLKQ